MPRYTKCPLRRAQTLAIELTHRLQHRLARIPGAARHIENCWALTAELDAAGVRASVIARSPVDAIRRRRGLSQEQSAIRYGLDLAALPNWEQGRTSPDTATTSYFRAIAARPVEVAEALEMGP